MNFNDDEPAQGFVNKESPTFGQGKQANSRNSGGRGRGNRGKGRGRGNRGGNRRGFGNRGAFHRGGNFGGFGGGGGHGNVFHRIMLSSRAIGSIIGKAGTKVKEIREQSGARVRIIGNNCPERLAVMSGSLEQMVAACRIMASNIYEDFKEERPSRRPPKIMGRGQKSPDVDDIQFCLLLNEFDCGPIIGRAGARIKTYVQDTGCQVFVHNEYISGEFLPGSNEKVVTITGSYEAIPVACEKIFSILLEEGQGIHNTGFWDMEMTGPCGFFGNEATWKGSGMPNFQFGMPSFGAQQMMGPPPGMGGGPPMMGPGMMEGECGWPAPIPDGMTPILQELLHTTDSDGNLVIRANIEQVGAIMGQKGRRINQIRAMCGTKITVQELDGDSCMRVINVAKGPQECCTRNALWLMNISINAFCEGSASIRPFNPDCPIEQVVLSGVYGDPPGMTEADIAAEQQATAQVQIESENLDAPPAKLAKVEETENLTETNSDKIETTDKVPEEGAES